VVLECLPLPQFSTLGATERDRVVCGMNEQESLYKALCSISLLYFQRLNRSLLDQGELKPFDDE
jgi:hypothetical protein